MRTALVLVAIAGCGKAAEPTVYISIGADALQTAHSVAARDPVAVIDSDAQTAVLEFPTRDLDALSQQMHEQFHRCGGYIFHDSLDDARASLHMAKPVEIDYTLDRSAAVKVVLSALDRSKIHTTIVALSNMQNRYYQSPSGAQASIWLRDRWRSFTTRSDVTVELFDQGYPQKSVIMTILGSTRASEVVVIGGHLDSIARGGASSTAPGADDDASGIATLTEVARGLLANNFRPARTVKLIAYAAEEVGLRGSQAIVRDFKQRKINVVGALQLDMTNYQGSDKDIWLMKDFTSPAQNTFLTKLIDTYVGATWGLDACGYACSDHASWYRAGVPASMPFESRMRDRNRQIHTRGDTLERSGNNADHALKFARLGAAYAIELAKGELGPPDTTIASSTERSSHWKLYAILLACLAAAFAVRRRV